MKNCSGKYLKQIIAVCLQFWFFFFFLLDRTGTEEMNFFSFLPFILESLGLKILVKGEK